jgi:hypothetical protein
MQKQSTNVVEASQLALLESKIFNDCLVQDVMKDQHEMYTSFMCSDAAEDTTVRNHKTVSNQRVMNLLGAILTGGFVEKDVFLQITIEENNH